MKLYHDEITTPVRDAASIVLLRDHADGLQVFLMKRHGLSDVLGGAYVFPGGKVDEADAQLDAADGEVLLARNRLGVSFVSHTRLRLPDKGDIKRLPYASRIEDAVVNYATDLLAYIASMSAPE